MKKFLSLALIITLILSLTACADAAKKEKVKFNKRQLKKIELVESLSHGEPMIVLRENYSDVPIMGEAVATQDQMINYINKRNPDPKLNCSVENLVHLYYVEAGREGIRPDIALCQSIKETGVWAYGGDVVPERVRRAAASRARTLQRRKWEFGRTFNICCPMRRNVRRVLKLSTRATS